MSMDQLVTKNAERRFPVYKLINHKTALKQLRSFSENVALCNFTTRTGWKGKTYVDNHEVAEYQPSLRGADILDVYYLELTDTCVLTDLQYKDYCVVTGNE